MVKLKSTWKGGESQPTKKREQRRAGNVTTLRALNRHLAMGPDCFNAGCCGESLSKDSTVWTDWLLVCPFLILCFTVVTSRMGRWPGWPSAWAMQFPPITACACLLLQGIQRWSLIDVHTPLLLNKHNLKKTWWLSSVERSGSLLTREQKNIVEFSAQQARIL